MNSLRRAAEDALLEWMAQWPSGGGGARDDGRFNDLALRLFSFQWEACAPYQRLCKARGVSPDTVQSWREIPAVPTQAFKEITIRSFPEACTTHVFRTSGTSEGRSGELHLDRLDLYDASLLPTFRHFLLPALGVGERARIRVLAPSPEEAPHSSLSHMFGRALASLGDADSGYDIRDGALQIDSLVAALDDAIGSQTALLLAGTAFAFVHALDALRSRGQRFTLPTGSTLMETGGFKGRSREMPRRALYAELVTAFGIPNGRIINQYGMTELGSQFYDAVRPDGRAKRGPPWARVRIVESDSGEEQPEGQVGLIEVVDLANTGSVIAVRTGDLGRRVNGGFDVLGRAVGDDLRGCSVAADTMLSG